MLGGIGRALVQASLAEVWDGSPDGFGRRDASWRWNLRGVVRARRAWKQYWAA